MRSGAIARGEVAVGGGTKCAPLTGARGAGILGAGCAVPTGCWGGPAARAIVEAEFPPEEGSCQISLPCPEKLSVPG
jgi:hypothetical protein